MNNQELYPNLRQSVRMLIVLLALQIIFGIIAGVIANISQCTVSNDPIVMAILSVLSFGLIIRFAHKKTNQRWSETLQLFPFSVFILCPLILCLIGLLIVASEADNLLRYFCPAPEWINSFMTDITTSGFSSILLLGIVAPLSEEILFRGIILKGLVSRYSPTKAILISAILFSLFHLNLYQFFGAFMIGLLLGYLYFRMKSVLPCILAHSITNLLAVLASVCSIPIPGTSLPNTSTQVLFQPLWFDLTGLALLLIGFWLLLKTLNSMTTHAEQIAMDADKLRP
jgi:membrane protease YdiL (CAAX protease family)